ncbi:MAG: glycosyltransferase [Cyanobacteria bacterium J06600_6]
MSQPLVSVILSVKNGEKYLKDAIDSVLQQSWQNYEFLVIDGKSSDRTAKIAQSYSQIRYVRQQNEGIADAYNLGIQQGTGEILAFISHDDLWTPDKLKIQVKCLQDNPQLQYTVAKVKFFLETANSIPPGFRPELLTGEHTGFIMETLVVRKKLFETVGSFNSSYQVAEDVEWFSRIHDANIAHQVVSEVLLHKRVHNTNTSLNSSDNNQNLLKIMRQSIKRKRNQKSL